MEKEKKETGIKLETTDQCSRLAASIRSASTLSTRSKNCLINMGYGNASRIEIKDAIEKGELTYKGRNFGKKSFIEVCEWSEAIPPTHKKVCPHCGKPI